MSAFLLRAEASDICRASITCPQGVAGRVQSLRLRRHFQHPRRPHSIALGAPELNNGNATRNHTHKRESLRKEYKIGNGKQPSDSIGQAASRFDLTEETVALETEDAVSKDHSKDSEISISQGTYEVPAQLERVVYGDLHGLHFRKDKFDASFSEVKEIEKLYNNIRTGDPHTILRNLLSLIKVGPRGVEEARVIQDLPPNVFSEILRCLDPDQFVGRYLQLLKEISPSHPVYSTVNLEASSGLYRMCTALMFRVKAIIEARRSGGHSLALVDYEYLLRCARAVGNSKACHNIWQTMIADNVVPDTECYNQYMATKVWAEDHNPHQRFRLRIIPYHLNQRRSRLGRDRSSTNVRYQGHTIGTGGIKHEITSIFNRMVGSGSLGNEETFCLMMVAFGREGDIEGVGSILGKAWGVDVKALMAKEESDLTPVRQYAFDSPMLPSERLLLAIAHVYGINNEIHTALRLVDYVSRQYSIKIPLHVWEELFERTFVLSRPRSLKVQAEGGSTGQLPLAAVVDLWDALTLQPYNVKPTMKMFDKLITTLLGLDRFGAVKKKIEEARNEHNSVVFRYQQTILLIERNNTLLPPHDKEGPSAQLERQKAYEYLLIHRGQQYLRRWCRKFLTATGKRLQDGPEFQFQDLPKFVERHRPYLSTYLDYRTATGRIQLYDPEFVPTNDANIEAFSQSYNEDYEAEKLN